MDRGAFIAAYGGIFEHSPWIAGEVWDEGTAADDADVLREAFGKVIREAGRPRQLALLCAHPRLATAISSGEALTAESRSEQIGAGLDRCSAEEFEEFEMLNSTYTDKFAFPFIIAVKGLGRNQILRSFRQRLQNSREAEIREALEQVIRIGGFRLRDAMASQETASER